MGRRLIGAVKRHLSYPEEVQTLLATQIEQLLERAGAPLRILDLGCGTTSELAAFNRRPARRSCHLIGLDVHEPTIAWCRANGFHDEYLLGDALDHARLPEVDVVVATDLVEHLEKPAALQLLGQLEQKVTTAIVLLTPNGYIFNPFTADNPYMEHKCGFTAGDLEAIGYECLGVGGPRGLRVAGSLPRSPRLISMPLLALLSPAMRRLPRQSFHLLARKSLAHRPGH